jgi:hypothetical protein
MKILSIGKNLQHDTLDIINIEASQLLTCKDIESYNYIVINGGDGTIRRVLKQLHNLKNLPTFILNPTGSFNVVAKIHRVPKIETVLDNLANNIEPKTEKHHLFRLNDELFLFSAGNMGDLQHIFLSETLRFGMIKHGILKYAISLFFLLPVHIVMTPFMLMSSSRFFIFTPMRFIKKFGSFYGEVKEINIDLQNTHNVLELDGDVIILNERHLYITEAGNITVVSKK